MTSWSLAGNLDCRADAVRAQYPGITVYSIGDQQHQSGQSDHNPDAREIVHAIDVMTYDDHERGEAILAWLLSDPTDLEYVIFAGRIYERSNGFDGREYTGSDPHNDHVHASGKHGNTGWDESTGTGYDTYAEAYRPAPMGDDMPYTEDEMQAFPWQYDGRGMRGVPEGNSTLWVLGELYANLGALTSKVDQLQKSIDAMAPAGATADGSHYHAPPSG